MDTYRADNALEKKRNELKRCISDPNVENCLVRIPTLVFRHKLWLE